MTRFQTNSEGKEQVELGTTNTETKIFSVGVHVDANHADIAEITSDQMLEVDAIPQKNFHEGFAGIQLLAANAPRTTTGSPITKEGKFLATLQ